MKEKTIFEPFSYEWTGIHCVEPSGTEVQSGLQGEKNSINLSFDMVWLIFSSKFLLTIIPFYDWHAFTCCLQKIFISL